MERWRRIVLGAASERRRAQKLGILSDPFLPEKALLRRKSLFGTDWMAWVEWTDGTDLSMDDRQARNLTRSLRSAGIGAWAFNVSSTKACILFGAGDLRKELRPFEAESIYADWGVSEYFAFQYGGFKLARERAAHLAGLLAGAAALPRGTGENEIALLAGELAKSWKAFLAAREAVDLRAVRFSRIVEDVYEAAVKVASGLHGVGPLERWPRAWALYWAAVRVSYAIDDLEMRKRPATREDARLCLDMKLWLGTLEREAEADLAEIDLLERLGEYWHLGIPKLSCSLLYWETPYQAPERVRKKWLAKARSRAELFGRARSS